ncbi:MAG: hypothetical protein ACK4ND_11895 [Cytophagaceae bacterium]
MPGCGYICPSCNDTGYDANGKDCTWCKKDNSPDQEEWMKQVHEGPCCGDLGRAEEE